MLLGLLYNKNPTKIHQEILRTIKSRSSNLESREDILGTLRCDDILGTHEKSQRHCSDPVKSYRLFRDTEMSSPNIALIQHITYDSLAEIDEKACKEII